MLLPFQDHTPSLDPTAWVAPGAQVIGDVRLEADTSLWYGAVLRAEVEPIVVGAGTNLQDGVVVHTDRGFPATVGRGVSVGHGAVLHGCTVGDGTLVGMSATVLNGAVIGDDCLLAAGTVVPEGMQVPARSLVAGVPGRVRRDLDDDAVARLRANAVAYVELARLHREAHAAAGRAADPAAADPGATGPVPTPT